jgi:hypothetical protein
LSVITTKEPYDDSYLGAQHRGLEIVPLIGSQSPRRRTVVVDRRIRYNAAYYGDSIWSTVHLLGGSIWSRFSLKSGGVRGCRLVHWRPERRCRGRTYDNIASRLEDYSPRRGGHCVVLQARSRYCLGYEEPTQGNNRSHRTPNSEFLPQTELPVSLKDGLTLRRSGCHETLIILSKKQKY